MPIKAENLALYPADWPEISLHIRTVRAEGRCECVGECGRHPGPDRCTALNGKPHPVTGSRVVLTVAHLVSATQLPVDFHVARATYADEIVELVGLLVPVDTERLERNSVMHDRALSEFIASTTARSARFVVALPGGTTSGAPGWPVVARRAARPEWVILSRWSLGGPPSQPTDVSAESAPSSQVEAGDPVFGPASLAGAKAEGSLRPTYEFSATGVRATSDAVRSLLRRDREYLSADGALDAALAPALWPTDARAFDTSVDVGHKAEPALGRAGFATTVGVVGEVVPADRAGDFGGTESGSGHAQLYHFGYMPENVRDENLAAFCQRCHLAYDADHHAETRAATRQAALTAAGVMPLFEMSTAGRAPLTSQEIGS